MKKTKKNLYGITEDHFIKDKNNQDSKKCYLSNIVYGDTHNFQAYILIDKYMLKNTRNNRDYDFVILHEIDSMFIDDYVKSTLISKEMNI